MASRAGRPAAIVTGGGQGIGRAIAARLVRDGYAVAIADLDGEAAEDAVQELGSTGAAIPIATDVSSETAVADLVASTLDAFGRIDALVNNAGISRNKPLAELSLADWETVIGTNLTAQFLCAKQAASHLAATGGSIVNIASTRALMSEADTEAYSASKGGVVALSHALAISLGPRVRVNCISPGWIDVSDWKKRSARRPAELTGRDHAQHPAGRVGRPEDVAACAAWLLSEGAGFVTGANVVLDGGMTRKMIYEE